MFTKSLVVGIAILLGGLTGIGTVSTMPNVAWAATILCPSAPTSECVGTPESDNIIGAAGGNGIDGLGGNDVIVAKNSADVVHGRAGNDVITGGKGTDSLTGDPGADLISGGEDNDKLFHNFASSDPDIQTQPDGSRDRIDCGPGNDEAWINVSVDHDLAVACETVHEG